MVVVSGAVTVLAVSACSSDGGSPVDPPTPGSTSGSHASVVPTSPVPSASPTGTAEEQILAQYKRFWTQALPDAFAAPAADRRAVLAPVAMDPALSQLVTGIANLERRGQTNYGFDQPISQTLRRVKKQALVRGCLDSSHSGLAEIESGKRLQRGDPRNRVLVRLDLDVDNVWRVYAVGYRPEATC
jgi:hypothetical protein